MLQGCGSRVPWTGAVPITEREPRSLELAAYPPDTHTARVNPPGFCWTPAEGARGYRLELRRAGGGAVVFATDPQRSTAYAHGQTLEAGEYAWQVVYLGEAGRALGVSRTRRFSLDAGVAPLPMPDVGQLRQRLSGVRPRLFLAGNRAREIKEAVAAGGVNWWRPFIEAADAAVAEQSYAEPAGYPDGKFTVDDWHRIYTPGKAGSAHAARAALAWRLTGDGKYLEAARRWMLTLASWDPRGSTSHGVKQPNGGEGNDEASMPILERMAMAWDWAGDQLRPEERVKVLAAMTERGNQVLEVLRQQDFHSRPYSNHEGRVLAFLGLAGLSFLGDIPEAEKWLDYVVRSYLTSYPPWGSDHGGWAQGISYWSLYNYYHTTFIEALRSVTETDILRRPFYRNTGYFFLYFQPPYATRGAFGDGGERGPEESQQVTVGRLAEAFDDPVLRWRAQTAPAGGDDWRQWMRGGDKWRQWMIEDVGGVLGAGRSAGRRPARPPSELDGSRYMADIGWAAMHSALGDAKNDVWALFKSSRFGSFGHSHADQNTFQLNAYGRPLLIDSGYYPSFGSAHHILWTRQTQAHNGILVNGRGQPSSTWAAGGRIESFDRHGPLTVVRGQAAGAYNVAQPEGVTRLWKKLLTVPVPLMSPKVESFERTLAFVASKTRPVLVVLDYVTTDKPATFDWLLHAANRMQADARSGTVRVADSGARLVVRLVSSRPVEFFQTDRFTVPPEASQRHTCALPPEECAAKFPKQWHLSARTRGQAKEARFLAVMVPYREGEPEPEIATVEGQDGPGFRVGGTEVNAWWGAGPRGNVRLGSLSGEGRFALRHVEGGRKTEVISP